MQMQSHNNIFPLEQNQKALRELMQTASFSLIADESTTGICSPSGNSSLSAFLPNSLLEASLLKPQNLKHFKQKSVPPVYMQNPENTMFCTSLHVSATSTCSSTNQQSGNLPFLPYPPTRGPTTFLPNPPNSDPPLPRVDEIVTFNKENPEDLMNISLSNCPAESFARDCQGPDYVKDGLTLTERQQLQNISEVLGIATINEDGESPKVNEIHEAPEVSFVPMVELDCNRNSTRSSISSINRNNFSSSHQLPEVGAVQKQRLRWTTELHELFIEAVNKLGGPEIATPKGILMHMKVDGLNANQVNSHLQKYRLAKKVPELKQDKRASSSKEKVQASSENDGDSHIERGVQLETQLMQIELQKLLHEQIKELRLCIMQQGEQLKKIMEQHEKPGSNLFPINSFPTSNSMSESEQALLCSFAGTSANQEESNTESSLSQPKHKASPSNESEQSRFLKRQRQE